MVTVANRMPLIEGVGDEVILFVGVTLLVICIVLAWFSTSVTDNHIIRTAVLVIERRISPSSITAESATAIENASTSIIESGSSTSKSSTLRSSSTATTATAAEAEKSSLETGLRHRSKVTVEDADSSVFGTAATSEAASGLLLTLDNSETGSLEHAKSETDASKKLFEPDVKRATSSPHFEVCRSEIEQIEDPVHVLEEQVETIAAENLADSVDLSEPGIIKIRLKFLNDSQKLVNGKLEEPLGDFKRRCFHEELDNDKVVRLIFNGQLLRGDQETLQFYGLHDNCVVHCQISSNLSNNTPVQNESYGELDLSRFMLPLFGVILGVIWYCRIQYRQFFNATSTFALLGITGLFFISLAAICIPRRERPPWAN